MNVWKCLYIFSVRSVVLSLLFGPCAGCDDASAPRHSIRVGSKRFTESVILGEILTQTFNHQGLQAEHQAELGATQVLFKALKVGSVDVYPEYLGTLYEEIFAGKVHDLGDLQRQLEALGLQLGKPLGFSNGYALAMQEQVAQQKGIRKISDLRQHPQLRYVFSQDFLDRPDGFPGVAATYGLAPRSVRGMDHDLTYQSVRAGTADVIDVYETDAEIVYYGLRVLEDDAHFFGSYQAYLVQRSALSRRASSERALFEQGVSKLESQITTGAMRAMNADVKLRRHSESDVAATFLNRHHIARSRLSKNTSPWRAIAERTREHLYLVSLSLLMAIVVALPLGVICARRVRLGRVILAMVGVVQTIPSLALLVMMIPLLGVAGEAPAIAALFLYSLLPIVRNTHTGLSTIPLRTREAAVALGLPRRSILLRIELPMASASILSGVKTSAVINVGTATLGALVGAGGYGQPILTGIRLDNWNLISQGAVPAALLALAIEYLFDTLEKIWVPRGLRIQRAERPV